MTTEALLMAMPFENYVQIYDLKGEYILEALEFSVGVTQSTPGVFSSGRMLQIGGKKVSLLQITAITVTDSSSYHLNIN